MSNTTNSPKPTVTKGVVGENNAAIREAVNALCTANTLRALSL